MPNEDVIAAYAKLKKWLSKKEYLHQEDKQALWLMTRTTTVGVLGGLFIVALMMTSGPYISWWITSNAILSFLIILPILWILDRRNIRIKRENLDHEFDTTNVIKQARAIIRAVEAWHHHHSIYVLHDDQVKLGLCAPTAQIEEYSKFLSRMANVLDTYILNIAGIIDAREHKDEHYRKYGSEKIPSLSLAINDLGGHYIDPALEPHLTITHLQSPQEALMREEALQELLQLSPPQST